MATVKLAHVNQAELTGTILKTLLEKKAIGFLGYEVKEKNLTVFDLYTVSKISFFNKCRHLFRKIFTTCGYSGINFIIPTPAD